jgi:hypothetical protein
MNWQNTNEVLSLKYKCAYCGSVVASHSGWDAYNFDYGNTRISGMIRICPHCKQPTYATEERQIPGAPEGEKVEGIVEKGVENIYDEARRAFAEGCYTATILCCRKLLVHIAVTKGAKEGLPFTEYVNYLEREHFVPPGCKSWIDEIRKKGNEANHEICIMTKEQAKTLLSFCEMLLKLIYEFLAKIAKK